MASDAPKKPRPTFTALLGVIVVWMMGLYPMLTGQAYPAFDADGFFAPYFMLIGDHARAGQLLLWDPWTECGTPIFADPQVGAYSPVVVGAAAAAGANLRGFLLYWFALWLCGGLGMMLLARNLGAPAWGAWATACGFGFSGFFYGHAQHLSFTTCFALLPWVVWRLDVALLERRVVPALEAGALWGLSALSGYPGMVMICGGAAFLWTLGRTLTKDYRESESDSASRVPTSQRASLKWAIVALAALVAIGLLVMSPAYFAFAVEGRGYSNRRDPLPREIAVGSNALPPRALYTFASPYLPRLQDVFIPLNAHLEAPSDVQAAELQLPAGQGLIVKAVNEGSPAAGVGLKINDVLLVVDDKPVPRDPDAFFKTAIRDVTIRAAVVDVVVLRDGQRLALNGLTFRWTDADVSALGLYVGGALSWLAVVGLALAKGNWRWWLLGIALVGLAFALGTSLPFRGWLYDLFPPARYFRHASIFRSYVIFALAALAAIGSREIERLRKMPASSWPLALPIAGVAMAAAGILGYRAAIRTVAESGPALANVHVWLTWTAVALLGLAGVARSTRAAALRGLPIAVVALTFADTWFTARLSTIGAFRFEHDRENMPAKWAAAQEGHDATLDLKSKSGLDRAPQSEIGPGNTNKHLYARLPVLVGYPNPMTSDFVPSFRKGWLLNAIVGKRPVLFAPRAGFVEPTRDAFAAFEKRTTDEKKMPMVLHPLPGTFVGDRSAAPAPESLVHQDDAPIATPVDVELVEYSPNRLAFTVTCPENGWLVLTDRWSSGWKATVDDKPVTVSPAMFLFRAVPVHEGVNRIEFTYRPAGHPHLVLMSWSVLGVVLLLAIGSCVLSRSRAPVSGDSDAVIDRRLET